MMVSVACGDVESAVVRLMGCRGGVVDRGRDLEGKRTFGETYNVVMVMMTSELDRRQGRDFRHAFVVKLEC